MSAGEVPPITEGPGTPDDFRKQQERTRRALFRNLDEWQLPTGLDDLALPGFKADDPPLHEKSALLQGHEIARQAHAEDQLRSAVELVKQHVHAQNQRFALMVAGSQELQAVGMAQELAEQQQTNSAKIAQLGAQAESGNIRLPGAYAQISEDIGRMEAADLTPEDRQQLQGVKEQLVSSKGISDTLSGMESVLENYMRRQTEDYAQRGGLRRFAEGAAGMLGAVEGEMDLSNLLRGWPGYKTLIREHGQAAGEAFEDLLYGPTGEFQGGPFQDPYTGEYPPMLSGPSRRQQYRQQFEGKSFDWLMRSPEAKALARSVPREEFQQLLRPSMKRAIQKAIEPYLTEEGQIEGEDSWMRDIGQVAGMLLPIEKGAQAFKQTARLTTGALTKLGLVTKAGLGSRGAARLAQQSLMELGKKAGVKGLPRLFQGLAAPMGFAGWMLQQEPNPATMQAIDDRIERGILDPKDRDAAIAAAKAEQAIAWGAFWPVYSLSGGAGGWLGRRFAQTLERKGAGAVTQVLGGGAAGGLATSEMLALAGDAGADIMDAVKLLSEEEKTLFFRQIQQGILAGAPREPGGEYSPSGIFAGFAKAIADGDVDQAVEAIKRHVKHHRGGHVVFPALTMVRIGRHRLHQRDFEEKLWRTAELIPQLRENLSKAVDQVITDPAQRKALKAQYEAEIAEMKPGETGLEVAARAEGRLQGELDRLPRAPKAAEARVTARAVTREEDARPRSIREEVQRVDREMEELYAREEPLEADRTRLDMLRADREYLTYKERELELQHEQMRDDPALQSTLHARAEAWRRHGERLSRGQESREPTAREFRDVERGLFLSELREGNLADRTRRDVETRSREYRESGRLEVDEANRQLQGIQRQLDYEVRRSERMRTRRPPRHEHAMEQAEPIEKAFPRTRQLYRGDVPPEQQVAGVRHTRAERRQVSKIRQAEEVAGQWMEKTLRPGDRLRFANGQEALVLGPADPAAKGADYTVRLIRVGGAKETWDRAQLPEVLTPRGLRADAGGIQLVGRGEKLPKWASEPYQEHVAQLAAERARIARTEERVSEAPTREERRAAIEELGERGAEMADRERTETADRIKAQQDRELPADRTEQEGVNVPRGTSAEAIAPGRPSGPAFSPGEPAAIETVKRIEGVAAAATPALRQLFQTLPRKARAAAIENALKGEHSPADRAILEAARDLQARGVQYGSHRFAAEAVNLALHRELGAEPTRSLGHAVEVIRTETRQLVEPIRRDPTTFSRWIAQRPELTGPESVAMRWYSPGVKALKGVQDLQVIARNAHEAGPDAMYWAWRGSGLGDLLHVGPLRDWVAGGRKWLRESATRRAERWTRQYRVDPFDPSVHTGPLRATVGRLVTTPDVVARHGIRNPFEALRTPLDAYGRLAADAARTEQMMNRDLEQVLDRFYHPKRGLLAKIREDSFDDHLIARLMRTTEGEGEWTQATEKQRAIARELKQFGEYLRRNTVEALPKMHAMERLVEFNQRELAARQRSVEELQGKFETARQFELEHPQVGRWQRELGELRGRRNRAAKKAKRSEEAREEVRALKQQIRDLEANIGETLRELNRTPAEKLEGALEGAERSVKQAERAIEALQAEMSKMRLRPEEGGWGLENWLRDIPFLDEDIQSYGRFGVIGERENVDPKLLSPAHRVTAGFLKKRDLVHGLSATGRADPSLRRSLRVAVQEAVIVNHYNRLVARNHELMFGKRVRAPQIDVLFPRSPEARNRRYLFDDIEVRSLGLQKRVVSADGQVTWREPKKGDRDTFLLLWRGVGPPPSLRNPAAVARAIKDGRLVVKPRHRSIDVQMTEGGLINTLDRTKAKNLEEWWNRVLRVADRVRGTEIEQLLEKGFRNAGYAISTKVLGFLNIFSASVAAGGAGFLNSLFLNPATFATSLRYPFEYAAKLMKLRLSGDIFADFPEGAIAGSKDIPSLMGQMAERMRTPESKLATMTKEQAARQRVKDDMWVDFYRSAVASGTRSYKFFERYKPFRPGQKLADVGLEPDATSWGHKIKNLGGWLMRAGWAPFEGVEFVVRSQLYGQVYMNARESGRSRKEADALASHAVMLSHGVFTRASKSNFFASPFGPFFGGVATWASHYAGGFMRQNAREKMQYLVSMMVVSQLAQMLGMDWTTVIGVPVYEIGEPYAPVGRYAESKLMGIGTATEDDPRGMEEKGPWAGGPGPMLPTTMVSLSTPALQILGDWGRFVHAVATGNTVERDRWLARALRDTFEPNTLNYLRRAGVQMPYEDKPAVGEYVEGKGYPYTPLGSDKMTEHLQATGLEQIWRDFWPGQLLESSKIWKESRLEAARKEHEKVQRGNIAARGREIGLEMRRLSELRKAGEDVTAETSRLRDEIGKLRERGETWSMEFAGDPKAAMRQFHEWGETASEWQRFDRYGQQILKAYSSRAKLEAFTRFLERDDITHDVDYAKDLMKAMVGKSELQTWLENSGSPEVVRRFMTAWRNRFPDAAKNLRTTETQPVGR